MEELTSLPTEAKILLCLAANAAFWATLFAVLYLTRSRWWTTEFGRVWAVVAFSMALALDLTIYSALSTLYHRPLGEHAWFYIQACTFSLLGASLCAITLVLIGMQKHERRAHRALRPTMRLPKPTKLKKGRKNS